METIPCIHCESLNTKSLGGIIGGSVHRIVVQCCDCGERHIHLTTVETVKVFEESVV